MNCLASFTSHKTESRLGILSVLLGSLFGVTAILAQPVLLEEPQERESAKAVITDDLWQEFPLAMINVTAADVAEVANLVDVVSYFSTFAPYEASNRRTQAQADALSFRIDLQAEPIIQAAEAAGLHVTITPALLAHPNAFLPNPLERFTGDGVVDQEMLYVEPSVVPGCVNLTDEACIRVPTNYDQITPQYIDYWAAKLPNFFQAVAAADSNGTVWGIYGSEEIRPWYDDLEYAAQRRLRSAIDGDPAMAGRPLLAYSPHNRMPENLAETLIAKRGVSGANGSFHVVSSPAVPHTFNPIWNDFPDPCWAIGPNCQVLGFDDYYPLSQYFAVDAAGDLIPMQDHLMRGSYLGLLLGNDGHLNRIASLHFMETQLEALSHVQNAYSSNGQIRPSHLAFHLPDLNLCSLEQAQTSAAEARHDFWSGVHRGQGIYIYNYQFVVQAENNNFTTTCPGPLPTPEQVLTVWDEYKIGLRLIKYTLRDYLVNGVRTYPVPFINVNSSVSETIAGSDYLIDHPITGANATLAMPDYPALNGSSYRIGNTAYLIVTGSYAQTVSFTVPFDSLICSMHVIHGDSSGASFVGAELSDSLEGIDGRVYRLELASAVGCS